MNERKRRIAGLAALIPTTVFALGNLGGGAVSAESNRELLIGPVPITRSDVEIEASRENSGRLTLGAASWSLYV